jgi:hypothetical protein
MISDPYQTIDAEVVRYLETMDEILLKLGDGRKLWVGRSGLSNASWFTALQTPPGKPVSLMIRRSALGV